MVRLALWIEGWRVAKVADDKRMLVTVWAAVLAVVLVLFGIAASAYAAPEPASSSTATSDAASRASSAAEPAAAVSTGGEAAKEVEKESEKDSKADSKKAGDASSSAAAADSATQVPASVVDRALDRRVIDENSQLSIVEGAEPDTGGSTFTLTSPIKYAQIPGDVYWLSNHPQLIGSRVGNDVLGAGFEVEIRHTEVAGDVRVAGQTVELENSVIAGNVDIVGVDVSVDSRTAANALYCGGGSVHFEGRSHGLFAYGQSIYFNGIVEGDVTLSAQDIVIGPDAIITGLLDIRSGQNLETLDIPASARIGSIDTDLDQPNTIDQITQIRAAIAPYFQVGSMLFVVVSFILLGLAALWGFGAKLTEANRLVRRYPLAVLVLGCIAVMFMFVIVMLGTVLIFTIPLAIIIALVFLISAIFCVPFTGASLALLFRRRVKPAFCVIAGTAIGAVLLFVPYVNMAVFAASLVYFVGYFVNILMFGHDRYHDASFHARQSDEDAPKGKASGILPVAAAQGADIEFEDAPVGRRAVKRADSTGLVSEDDLETNEVVAADAADMDVSEADTPAAAGETVDPEADAETEAANADAEEAGEAAEEHPADDDAADRAGEEDPSDA